MIIKILKKPLVIILLIFILLSGGGLVAYNLISNNFELLSYEIVSYNNLYAMSVPIRWSKSNGASKNAVIAAENPTGTMYAMMSADTSGFDEGHTIDEYIDSYISKIAEMSDDPLVQVVSVEPQQTEMGENTGYYFEIDTISNGITVHMWDFVFTGDGCYVHVDVVSSGEDNRSFADTAKNIISSARII
jgi:hypothetical protein